MGRAFFVFLSAVLVGSLSSEEPPVVVIGAGFSGLTAALELRRLGHRVVVHDKQTYVGGRANTWTEKGFTFDAGPSWYWMPKTFDRIFARFGRRVPDFYNLTMLNPAYRVVFPDEVLDVPGTLQGLLDWIAKVEPTAKESSIAFFEDAKEKFEKGINEWIWKPMINVGEMVDTELLRAGLTLNMFGSLQTHIERFTTHPRIQTLLKWPIIFIGASPQDAPAMYSLMTYAGHAEGTWYPSTGMAAPAKALAQIARDEGVVFNLGSEVTGFEFTRDDQVSAVCTKEGCAAAAGVVASADYHFVEQVLLPEKYRRYDEDYWQKQAMSPSVILFYLGVSRNVSKLLHHTFFFDEDLNAHLHSVFDDHVVTDKPTFYVSSTTVTDPSTAPVGSCSLFVLVPFSYHIDEDRDTQELRAHIFDLVIRRMEKQVGPLRAHLAYKKIYGPKDFHKDFHAFRGNAFGHANVLSQSLLFKPSMDSLLSNMVFAGHLTNPGPGVPPALVSGITAANLLNDKMKGVYSYVVWPYFALVLAVLLAWRMWRVPPWSELECSREVNRILMWKHGRTYFAAASLLDAGRFTDIACVYGLMRVADDYVDNFEAPEKRARDLAEFETKFWRAWERQTGRWADHPVLPGAVEAAVRLGFTREMFELFFRSMRQDGAASVVCHTLADTMEYMDGSAAIIGDFMLPLLMPKGSPEERAAALPHARDLGRAFQMTNFIRDIDEDLDLKRQYIPEEICEQFAIKLDLRDHKQPRFREFMEHLFRIADDFYVSADKGIAILPKDVSGMIGAASEMYHRLHEKIRSRGYAVYDGRARVPFSKKLSILSGLVGPMQIAKMIFTEASMRWKPDSWAPGLLFLTLVWGVCELFSLPSATYGQFHCIFIVPQLLLMVLRARMCAPTCRYFRDASICTLCLCVVATVWTTPWDNYLVATGVWNYPAEDRVLAVIGYVPLEEYLFFSLQSMLVAASWVAWACPPPAPPQHSEQKSHRRQGQLFMLLLLAASVACLRSERSFYLGMVTAWAVPVLFLQWSYGAEALWAQRWSWLAPVFLAWAYLCIADRWAMRMGIWSIRRSSSIPRLSLLPFEEAWFFLLTTLMCTWTLVLVMSVRSVPVASFGTALRCVHRWGMHPEKTKAIEQLPANRLTPLERAHLPIALVGAVLGIAFGGWLSTPQQVAIVVGASVLFGLPHGALDPMLGEMLLRGRPYPASSFLAIYLLAMALTLATWLVLPTTSLVLFFIVSVLHFGEGDASVLQRDSVAAGGPWLSRMLFIVEVISRGGLILLPIQAHPAAVTHVFSVMVGGADLSGALAVFRLLGRLHWPIFLLCACIHLARARRTEHVLAFVELVVLAVLFWVGPPLVSFALYFVLFHSTRHLIRLNSRVRTEQTLPVLWRHKTKLVVGLVTLSIFLGLGAARIISNRNDSLGGRSLSGMDTALRVLFVGLSCLTSPHMYLVYHTLQKPRFAFLPYHCKK